MLNKVHHVTYVVENVDDMAAYIERNFSLTPIRSDEFTERGFKSILYQIGDTLVDFFQPLRDDTPTARQLRETGPGVMHVAWGVDGIGQLFNDLQANGNDMRGDGPSASPFGYLTASIEPASSHGIYFQLAEGEHS
ncbi:Methylmalonyl-CoA epimerase [Geodia barretti]|uniref:Methylmalonyl-CoA epimerase n=1 Tax=Geodia barretti TaxID=519541 RepID=A0AA35RK12_GEOBA|nr:Methylmalonyl-CoA epimerase [Geodia barretti]